MQAQCALAVTNSWRGVLFLQQFCLAVMYPDSVRSKKWRAEHRSLRKKEGRTGDCDRKTAGVESVPACLPVSRLVLAHCEVLIG